MTMVRKRTRSRGDYESDEALNETDEADMARGKRQHSRQQEDSKKSTNDGPAPKRRRHVDETNEEDPFMYGPRRSTRKILLETQREYEKSQGEGGSALFDAELDSGGDDDFLGQPQYCQARRSSHPSHSLASRGSRHNEHYGSPASSRQLRHSRSSRRHNKHVELEDPEGDDEDEEVEECVRRSQRQRHTHFDSLNMSVISRESVKADHCDDLDKRECSRRPRVKHEEENDGEDGEEEEEGEGEEEEEEEEDNESSEMELVEVEVRRPGLRPRTIKVPRHSHGHGEQEEMEEDGEAEEEEEEGEGEEDLPPQRSYFLRKKKPTVDRYQAPPPVVHMKRGHREPRFGHNSPARHRRHYSSGSLSIRSPAKKLSSSRRHQRAHNNSSSTSTSGSSSGDEGKFERRKSRSMRKARDRCLPMNFSEQDLHTHTVTRDRMRIGASLADIDPMSIDRSVSFESVGGLGDQVSALKEMVVFPLLYPEVFNQFGIQPPRGVLFHGPPGTGKTLVARALANECGTLASGQQRVAFFMRKGADCLSKWVGESERQLRLLFDQAYNMRPSIIFFDEIDGLAPVRSTRQDQIHSSIVSTLLALMDGLDSRGEVVIIGATNRIDSIDPALRRPGRFDREFRFPLPDRESRRHILKIHTKAWDPPLSDEFVSALADRTVGYCGADVKALCSEVALCALRRTYPQIYSARDKLLLDMSKIKIGPGDFASALHVVVPTTVRSHASPSWPLKAHVAPLLDAALVQAKRLAEQVFPSCKEAPSVNGQRIGGPVRLDSAFSSLSGIPMHRDSNGMCSSSAGAASSASAVTHCLPAFSLPHRPRLLLYGPAGSGVCDHIAPALLHSLERLPMHTLDMSTLYSVTAHSPEEACAQLIREAARTAPCVLYLPRLHLWWSSLSATVLAAIQAQLSNIPPSTPLFVLGTVEKEIDDALDCSIVELFSNSSTTLRNSCAMAIGRQNGTAHTPFLVAPDQRSARLVSCPSSDERHVFFKPMLVSWLATPLPSSVVSSKGEATPPTLPVAPAPEPRQLSAAEQKQLLEDEETHLRELRIFLRDCTTKLVMERKFKAFCKPVDLEEAPDYLEIIKDPIDLEQVMQSIDAHKYTSGGAWLNDIELIASNCIEYNPRTNPRGKALRHRAFTLRDVASSLIDLEMKKEFEERCLEIEGSRRKRGYVSKHPGMSSRSDANQDAPPQSNGSGKESQHSVRRSLRVHGIQPDDPVEIVKIWSTPTKDTPSPMGNGFDNPSPRCCSGEDFARPDSRLSDSNVPLSSVHASSDSDSSCALPSPSPSLPNDSSRRTDHHRPPAASPSACLSVPDIADTAADSGLGGETGRPASCDKQASTSSQGMNDSGGVMDITSPRDSSSPLSASPSQPSCNQETSDVDRRVSRRLAFSVSRSSSASATSTKAASTGAISPSGDLCEQQRRSTSPANANSVDAMSASEHADPVPIAECLVSTEVVDHVLSDLVTSTNGFSVSQLETVHASLSQLVQDVVRQQPRPAATSVEETLSGFCQSLHLAINGVAAGPADMM
ncbi:ATPase family AAA domain-containing protein 2-like [Sycon ciliatum]|uniref:ATPase family AAA domain-containing protein 2-like n=1 Tax=Sycon ciliatum TaxID=27933 RepID=UPI0031F68B34